MYLKKKKKKNIKSKSYNLINNRATEIFGKTIKVIFGGSFSRTFQLSHTFSSIEKHVAPAMTHEHDNHDSLSLLLTLLNPKLPPIAVKTIIIH
jgi:hypothetical protein